MATNFLDQVLNLTGLKLPDTESSSSPAIYKNDAHTEKRSESLTGVDRYQQQKQTNASELTGTAKYLAKKQQKFEEEAAKLSSVDQYLIKKEKQIQDKAKADAAVLAKMTGVEKYLSNLAAHKKTITDKIASKETIKAIKPSRVDEYLDKQKQTVAVIPAKEKLEPGFTTEDEADNETSVVEEQTANETITPTKEASQSLVETTATAEAVINLADDAKQCQARTTKGSQCQRKTGLEAIEKRVDGHDYKFAVCGQHNNDAFVPFEGFLQKN